MSKREKSWKQQERKKLIKKITIWGLVAIVIIGLIFWINNSSNNSSNFQNPDVLLDEVPSGQIHWHPKLTINIDGEDVIIPNNIGLAPGRHSPTHTHDEGDGTIHLENMNPKAQPETMSLGYFFNEWKQPFNETCILDKCSNVDGGELKMFVNKEENFEFENYIFKGEDVILIEYKSK